MARFIETSDGFDFMLDGKRHGTWRSKSEAVAGLHTEMERKRRRDDEESARQMAYTDAETQRHHEWRNRD